MLYNNDIIDTRITSTSEQDVCTLSETTRHFKLNQEAMSKLVIIIEKAMDTGE